MKVSYFERATTDEVCKEINLKKWLHQTINPPKDLKKKVLKYRFLKSKSLKQQIPCITVSATFKKVRNLDRIKNKTGLICLDIDPKENPVLDLDKAKQLFSQHPSVLYVGRSVSNNGIYVIMVVDPKVKLIKYFKYFRKQLRSKGIIIDESCKDYTRLRFFSIDPDAYLNLKAKVFHLPKKRKIRYKGKVNTTDNRQKVEAIVALIEQHKTDITKEYNDWIKIAGALNNAFGGSGLEYFKRISQFHPDYKAKKVERKYEKCGRMNNVSLNSFFYVAGKYGFRY